MEKFSNNNISSGVGRSAAAAANLTVKRECSRQTHSLPQIGGINNKSSSKWVSEKAPWENASAAIFYAEERNCKSIYQILPPNAFSSEGNEMDGGKDMLLMMIVI